MKINITIFNCKSTFAKRKSIKCNLKHSFVYSNIICKIASLKYIAKDHYKNKIQKNKYNDTKINFNNIYHMSRYKILIKNDILERMAESYQITNLEILNNLDFFYKMTKIYIDLYIERKEHFIKNNIDSIFIILKFHEPFITKKRYSKMKIEEIFTKELMYRLEYL